MIQRTIPATGEKLPVIGLGTWKVLDVPDSGDYPRLTSVLQAFYDGGGRLIDSSPMYGRSEEVIGDVTDEMDIRHEFFYATKVWTEGREEGIRQMEASMQKMKRERMDLMQIHNLVDWQTHLKTLRSWKEQGRIRYIGITHYQDAMHEQLAAIIRKEPVDFVQFNYSASSRHAETMLLPVCAEKGVATLINRPMLEGKLMGKVEGRALPEYAKDLGITNWSQFFLKYIIAHPGVTCVIPATGNPVHMAENMKAADGFLPDDNTRRKMAALVDGL